MKQTKLYHATNVCWAILLMASFITRGWNPDLSIMGIVITIVGWSSVQIIRAGIASVTHLIFGDE